MVEIAQKRIEVRRDRIGLPQEEGVRGINPTPASVDEAVKRLLDVEERSRSFHKGADDAGSAAGNGGGGGGKKGKPRKGQDFETASSEKKEVAKERKLFNEGRLTHRTEPDLKTHTSYLTFAVLPREWTAEDEARAERKVKELAVAASKGKGVKKGPRPSHRQLKRDLKAAGQKAEAEVETGAEVEAVAVVETVSEGAEKRGEEGNVKVLGLTVEGEDGDIGMGGVAEVDS